MLIIIVLLIILVYLLFPKYEIFDNLNIYATRLLGIAKHVKLNKFNRIDSIHVKPPVPKIGESKCNKIVCPKWIPENTICYKCI
jgi:hypothetical protein